MREWVSVLFRDLIKASEVGTELERTVLFPGEEDRSAVRGERGSDEPHGKMFVEEFSEEL